MAEARHRTVEANGIRMHLAERGEGPVVLLCHGFPETWYSWRHPLPALAEAGVDAMPELVPGLTGSRVVERGGHWIQQEKPAEVNALLIGFLRSLPT